MQIGFFHAPFVNSASQKGLNCSLPLYCHGKIEKKCGGKPSTPQQVNKMAKNEREHSSFGVSELIRDVKEHLGLIIVAEAGHGKSYTAFSIVKEAMKDRDTIMIVLSPSTIWRRKFGAINYVKVGTTAFNPIVSSEETDVEVVPFLRDAIHVNLSSGNLAEFEREQEENDKQQEENDLREIEEEFIG